MQSQCQLRVKYRDVGVATGRPKLRGKTAGVNLSGDYCC